MTRDLHTALEERLFRAVNVDLGPAADALALVLSSRWTGIAVGLCLVAAFLLLGRRRRELGGALRLVAAIALAVGLSDWLGYEVLKPLIGRMRPCYALQDIRWIAGGRDVGSLPSLHAANLTAMAVVALAAHRGLGIGALVLAAGVAWSRIYVGVHWPTDVLAGAAWGAACAVAAIAITGRAAQMWAARRRRGRGSPVRGDPSP